MQTPDNSQERIDEVEAKITVIYNTLNKLIQGYSDDDISNQLVLARSYAHEMLAECERARVLFSAQDKEESKPKASNESVDKDGFGNPVVMTVHGVQLIEHGSIIGTALYQTVPLARSIKNAMNMGFVAAENAQKKKLGREAKLIQYPVYGELKR